MTDWPGDMAPLPHAPTADRLAARFAAMLAPPCGAACPGECGYDPNDPTDPCAEESDR